MVIDARSYERQRGQERAGGAYARNYVRTYVCKAYVRTYVPTVSPTYVRTHVMGCGADFVSLTYARVRAYVLFHLPRTYARTYVLLHLPPCATYCFTCHVRTHLRTVSFATYVRIVSLATYVRTVSIATYVGLALPRCPSRCGKGVAKMLFTYVGLALPRCSDNCGKGGALGRSVRAGFWQSPLRRRGRQ